MALCVSCENHNAPVQGEERRGMKLALGLPVHDDWPHPAPWLQQSAGIVRQAQMPM